MEFEIIDFHTHPFTCDDNNLCPYASHCNMTPYTTIELMDTHNVINFCGSVICFKDREGHENQWQTVKQSNDLALELAKKYDGRYIPGFHVHPSYVRESCEEVERMGKLGIKLLGELVPYIHGWPAQDYTTKELDEILDVAASYNMVVSFHSSTSKFADMIKKHPDITFVGAHPDEYNEYMFHLELLKECDNYYLDLSGYGVFRQNMLRYGIDKVGVEKFIFGSDYPTCSLPMYIGAVLLDTGITDTEKEYIFLKNAKRLLNL